MVNKQDAGLEKLANIVGEESDIENEDGDENMEVACPSTVDRGNDNEDL